MLKLRKLRKGKLKNVKSKSSTEEVNVQQTPISWLGRGSFDKKKCGLNQGFNSKYTTCS